MNTTSPLKSSVSAGVTGWASESIHRSTSLSLAGCFARYHGSSTTSAPLICNSCLISSWQPIKWSCYQWSLMRSTLYLHMCMQEWVCMTWAQRQKCWWCYHYYYNHGCGGYDHQTRHRLFLVGRSPGKPHLGGGKPLRRQYGRKSLGLHVIYSCTLDVHLQISGYSSAVNLIVSIQYIYPRKL